MADVKRKTALDRLSTLAIAPFYLGRRALSLDWLQAPSGPPQPQAKASSPLALPPPEHAIKRRG